MVLAVHESFKRPGVLLEKGAIILRVKPGSDCEARRRVLDRWYRDVTIEHATSLVEKWQKEMGVQARRVDVRRMKTRWGTCNPRTGTLRLNSELAKRKLELLEYVVVHELVHLLEPSHNERFAALMQRYLPTWRRHRAALRCI